jgi:DNA mismatch repair protein MutL
VREGNVPAAEGSSIHDDASLDAHRRELVDWAKGQLAGGGSVALAEPDTEQDSAARGLDLRFDRGESSALTLHRLAARPGEPRALAAEVSRTDTTPGTNASGALASPRSSGGLQIQSRYIVTETDEGMVVIDQHALHERIMFEELSARIMRGALESQRLLIPETIPASSRQIALLEQIQPLLNRLGIEASQFGPNSVAVQAFPSFLHKLEPGVFVAELLERGEQELLDLHEEELLHEILDMMACKAAVKAGDPLSTAEIEALLARRELIERSSNCPHGRPTTLRLSLRDLEKQFKRTGF